VRGVGFLILWRAFVDWVIADDPSEAALDEFAPLVPPRPEAEHYPPRLRAEPEDELDEVELPPHLDADGNLLRD
jgi:hypothetical protein